MFADFRKNTLYKLPNLFFGFALCSFGITMMYKVKDLGLGPWDVLHTGLMNYTPFTIGQISQVMGFLVILVGMTLGVNPGVGTILNMIFVGYFIDLFDNSSLLFTPDTFWGKILMLQAGIWILSAGIYFYLKSGIGAGPRDGLMLGLVKRTNLSVKVIKTSMEVTVVILGYLLGGRVGIGTVIVALTMGYAVQVVFSIGKYDTKTAVQRSLKDEFLMVRKAS